jgi:hypothetical protein
MHVRMRCCFVCDAVDFFNSEFSNHKLLLATYYCTILIIYISDTYYGVVKMLNVNKGRFVSVMWIIIIIIFINCNWVVTRWQYTFKHKQYTEQHK